MEFTKEMLKDQLHLCKKLFGNIQCFLVVNGHSLQPMRSKRDTYIDAWLFWNTLDKSKEYVYQ
jgi:hypothetical protein